LSLSKEVVTPPAGTRPTEPFDGLNALRYLDHESNFARNNA
jgi:hypothetical protein